MNKKDIKITISLAEHEAREARIAKLEEALKKATSSGTLIKVDYGTDYKSQLKDVQELPEGAMKIDEIFYVFGQNEVRSHMKGRVEGLIKLVRSAREEKGLVADHLKDAQQKIHILEKEIADLLFAESAMSEANKELLGQIVKYNNLPWWKKILTWIV